MDLSLEISAAENLFREKLEVYLYDIFRGITIDSHGPDHHRRVWKYARDLMGYPEVRLSITDSTFPLKLIIGSYLHDSGMAIDPGSSHGELSRGFCEKFILENGLRPADFTDMLEAVENHDKKEYNSPESKTILFDILTVADDLDALGYTGIYRYIEIYLMREKPFTELGNLITANVTGRFKNLERTFGHLPSFTARVRPRLDIITGFFEKYNIRSKSYRFGSGDPEGYCGVAEIIGSMVSSGENIEDVIYSSVESHDRVISWFFGELNRELTI
jgi:HD superfamily phosphodiesterase